MPRFIKVATTSEIASGTVKKVELGGSDIAVFNINGSFHAIDEMCPHRGGPLSEGEVDGNLVTCSWHGWQFDVTTGRCPGNPIAKVSCYQVKIEGDDILVSA